MPAVSSNDNLRYGACERYYSYAKFVGEIECNKTREERLWSHVYTFRTFESLGSHARSMKSGRNESNIMYGCIATDRKGGGEASFTALA